MYGNDFMLAVLAKVRYICGTCEEWSHVNGFKFEAVPYVYVAVLFKQSSSALPLCYRNTGSQTRGRMNLVQLCQILSLDCGHSSRYFGVTCL
jgi:hypothetical protein